MELTEKKLIKQAQEGNQHALAEIVKKYEKMVYNLGLRLLGKEEDAECVLQETFVKVIESISKFKGEAQLSTWIYRIATNEALMRLRKKKQTIVPLSLDQEDYTRDYSKFLHSFSDDPLNKLITSELREKMQDSIKYLPPKYKSVFILKDIEGLSLKEISNMLEISVPAVKSNLHRARLFLRERLAEYADERN